MHPRLGYFRTFLWFYEPALIISVELSPLKPEEYGGFLCHGVMPSNASTLWYSFSDMLNPDRPVQISSALQGNQNMINDMIEACSSATHSAGSNKCGQMRRNGELFQLFNV